MKVLQILSRDNDTVVKEIDFTGKTDSQVKKIERGVLLNLNFEEYYVIEISK